MPSRTFTSGDNNHQVPTIVLRTDRPIFIFPKFSINCNAGRRKATPESSMQCERLGLLWSEQGRRNYIDKLRLIPYRTIIRQLKPNKIILRAEWTEYFMDCSDKILQIITKCVLSRLKVYFCSVFVEFFVLFCEYNFP